MMRKDKLDVVEAIQKETGMLFGAFTTPPVDASTLCNIEIVLSALLRSYKERRLINMYYVSCNEANNPPYNLRAGRLVVDVRIQPYHAAMYIDYIISHETEEMRRQRE
jgi:phage tail sheath protein FI